MGGFISKQQREPNIQVLHQLPGFSILDELLETYPDVADIPFASPLQFPTVVTPTDLRNGSDASLFKIDVGDESAQSVATQQGSNEPFYEINLVGTNTKNTGSGRSVVEKAFYVQLSTLRYLNIHLKHVGDNIGAEFLYIIQEEADLMKKIVGKSGMPQDLLTDELMSQNGSKASSSTSSSDDIIKMLLLLNKFDLALLETSVEIMESNPGKITLEKIQMEVDQLKLVCGDTKDHPIAQIEFISDYVTFSSSVYAPPWRANMGEICYLKIATFDVGVLYLVATHEGLYRFQGIVLKDGEETMDYDRIGKAHPTISHLLKALSSHFEKHYSKQDPIAMLKQMPPSPKSPRTRKARPPASPRYGGSSSSLSRNRSNEQEYSDDEDMEYGDEEQQQEQVTVRLNDIYGDAGSSRGESSAFPPIADNASVSSNGSRTSKASKTSKKKRAARQQDKTEELLLKTPKSERWSHLGAEMEYVESERQKRTTKGKSKSSGSSSTSSGQARSNTKGTSRLSKGKSPFSKRSVKKKSNIAGGPNKSLTSHSSGKSGQSKMKKTSVAQQRLNLAGIQRDSSGASSSRTGKPSQAKSMRVNSSKGLTKASLSSKLSNRSKSKKGMDEDEDEESDDDDEDEDVDEQTIPKERPPDYHPLKKLIEFIRTGNPNATVIAMSSINNNYDLVTEPFNQLIFKELDGLEPLVNLIEMSDQPKHQLGAIQILANVSRHPNVQVCLASIGVMQPLVQLLQTDNAEILAAACQTIGWCCGFAPNRRSLRRLGGIALLADKLEEFYNKIFEEGIGFVEAKRATKVVRSVAHAIWRSCKANKNKQKLHEEKGIQIILAILNDTDNANFVIPLVNIVRDCAADASVCRAIANLGVIERLVDLVREFRADEHVLSYVCHSLFACCEDSLAQEIVRKQGGLLDLKSILFDKETGISCLRGALGALWKLAKDVENCKVFTEMRILNYVIQLLRADDDDLIFHAAGFVKECSQYPDARQVIASSPAVEDLVELLKDPSSSIQTNSAAAIGACAQDERLLGKIEELDGIRLLWSLLKSNNAEVQASAAFALCPCIQGTPHSGLMVRSFVGGLQMLVGLLASQDTQVQAGVCAAIAVIGLDEENLAIMTDHGVVPLLSRLLPTRNDVVRRHIADAVATCAAWGNNRESLESVGAVEPLVSYLKSQDADVHRSAATALYELSKSAENAYQLRMAGAVKLLVALIGSTDAVLQEKAAGAISNVRKWHLHAKNIEGYS